MVSYCMHVLECWAPSVCCKAINFLVPNLGPKWAQNGSKVPLLGTIWLYALRPFMIIGVPMNVLESHCGMTARMHITMRTTKF